MKKITNGSSIVTYTGKMFDILNPNPELIEIEDIAHSLANSCRYNGHCKDFLSVAEHSVHVSEQLSDEFALWGLLHDATECYVGDMVKPLKNYVYFFQEVEEKVMKVVAEKFELSMPEPKEVKIADYRMLLTEQQQLFDYEFNFTKHPVKPYDNVKISCWAPRTAKRIFLMKFYELTQIRRKIANGKQ